MFDYPNVSKVGDKERNLDEHFECGQGGAQARGTFGPFGLLLLADKELRELSAVFFYISHVKNVGWTTRFCADPTRCDITELTYKTFDCGRKENLLKTVVDCLTKESCTVRLLFMNTLVCRGSLARGIDTTIYGSFVNVLESEDFLSARIFVSSALSNLLMVQKNMGLIISALFVYV